MRFNVNAIPPLVVAPFRASRREPSSGACRATFSREPEKVIAMPPHGLFPLPASVGYDIHTSQLRHDPRSRYRPLVMARLDRATQ
jgi:hypothetical protein